MRASEAGGIIKRALDGTFTRVDRIDGKIVTTSVPRDYIPDHQAHLPPENVGKRGPGTMPRHLWTPEEDIELQRLRRLGWSKMRCAHTFNCSEEAVRRRLQLLRERQTGAAE